MKPLHGESDLRLNAEVQNVFFFVSSAPLHIYGIPLITVATSPFDKLTELVAER
jgi:hypothetical protein